MPLSGTVARQALFRREAVGSLVATSSLSKVRHILRTVVGSLRLAGALGSAAHFYRSVTGSIYFTATTDRVFRAFRVIAGSLYWTGNAVGSLLEELAKTVQGALRFASTVTRTAYKATRTVTGNLVMTSALTKQAHFFRTIAGSFTWAGTVTRGLIERTVAGVLYFASTLQRKVTFSRTVSGELRFASSLDRTVHFFRTIAASLTFTSTLSKLARYFRTAFGSLTFSGDASKLRKVFKTITGALSFASSTDKVFRAFRTVSGSLGTLSATLTRKVHFYRTVQGAIRFAGFLSYIMGEAIYGVLRFTSTLTRKVTFFRSTSGSLRASGEAQKQYHVFKTVIGNLWFSGRALVPALTNFVKKGLNRFGFNFKED